jgi:hypothetical protein
MILVKPSKDILQLNKGFNFRRDSAAFDEQGKLYLPHNARFQAGKFGKALFVEEGTRNHYPNPNNGDILNEIYNGQGIKEVIPSKSPFGGVVVRTTRKSLSDTQPISAAKSVNKVVIPVNKQVCFSAYTRSLGNTLNNQLKLMIYFNTHKLAYNSTNFSFSDTWDRNNFSCVNPGEENTGVHVYILAPCYSEYTLDDGFDACAPQVEVKSYPTTFTEGTRAPEIVTIPISTISPTGGQWDHYVYVNDMARRQVAGQTPTLFHIPRQDGGMGIRVCHAEDTANWKLQTMDDTNNITEAEALDTLTPDGWHRFTVKWTEAEAKLLIDGVVAGTIANPALPSVFAQDAYVGSYDGNENFLNTLHDDIRVSNIARADADDLADYQIDQPLPIDSSTIHKQSFDSPNNTYVRQGLVL